MKKISVIGLWLFTFAMLSTGASGVRYRGKFVGGGYAPDFIGHGGGLTIACLTNTTGARVILDSIHVTYPINLLGLSD